LTDFMCKATHLSCQALVITLRDCIVSLVAAISKIKKKIPFVLEEKSVYLQSKL